MSGGADDVLAIDDGCQLYRRIHPDHYVYDPKIGRKRVSSAAFKDPDLSVDLGSVLEKHGLNPEVFCLRHNPDDGLCTITARIARENDQEVVADPINPENPAHALVRGRKNGKKPSKMAKAAVVIRPPPGCE